VILRINQLFSVEHLGWYYGRAGNTTTSVHGSRKDREYIFALSASTNREVFLYCNETQTLISKSWTTRRYIDRKPAMSLWSLFNNHRNRSVLQTPSSLALNFSLPERLRDVNAKKTENTFDRLNSHWGCNVSHLKSKPFANAAFDVYCWEITVDT